MGAALSSPVPVREEREHPRGGPRHMRHVASVVSGREVAKGCPESALHSLRSTRKKRRKKIEDEESPGVDHPGVSFLSSIDPEKSRYNLH